jgi:hypothetical protein
MSPIHDEVVAKEPPEIEEGYDEAANTVIQVANLYLSALIACPVLKTNKAICDGCKLPQRVDCDMFGEMWYKLKE